MRLDKYLCKALGKTRTEVIPLITKGHIEVNNTLALHKDFHIDEEKDVILYDGKRLDYREFVYIMLNKPSGVVSAVVDDRDQTVVDLIKERKDIFPVGRLDKDTEGLLILTNNGKITHKLTNPKHDVIKKYFVKTKTKLTNDYINAFKEGFMLYDGNKKLYKTKPSAIEIIDDYSAHVSISEGKYHQIKKMFMKMDNEVVYLKRLSMGNITLDENLQLGEYRFLTDDEIQILKKSYDI